MNLITTLPRFGDAGSIVDTREPHIITCRYTSALVAQQYTLNLNPISGAITNLATYTLSVRGSQSNMVFRSGVGTDLLDLTSQLVAHINRFGYLWAYISGSGIITLASREPGIDNMVLLQGALFGATLTQTVAPSSPPLLTAGTLVVWDVAYNPTNPWNSNTVMSMSAGVAQGGFDFRRDVAGVVVRQNQNYSSTDQISGTEIEVMRTGNIWVRNYGATNINRRTITAVNQSAATPLLPSGAFGTGAGYTNHDYPLSLQYQSVARPNETAILSINLA